MYIRKVSSPLLLLFAQSSALLGIHQICMSILARTIFQCQMQYIHQYLNWRFWNRNIQGPQAANFLFNFLLFNFLLGTVYQCNDYETYIFGCCSNYFCWLQNFLWVWESLSRSRTLVITLVDVISNYSVIGANHNSKKSIKLWSQPLAENILQHDPRTEIIRKLLCETFFISVCIKNHYCAFSFEFSYNIAENSSSKDFGISLTYNYA